MTPRAEGGPVALAVEGCTGWRYVVEEIEAAEEVAQQAGVAAVGLGPVFAAMGRLGVGRLGQVRLEPL
jgi:hypothetical protein